MSFSNTCPVCKTKLIPIYYGRLDYIHLDLQKAGRLILGGIKKRKYNSHCSLCEESFEMNTDLPD